MSVFASFLFIVPIDPKIILPASNILFESVSTKFFTTFIAAVHRSWFHLETQYTASSPSHETQSTLYQGRSNTCRSAIEYTYNISRCKKYEHLEQYQTQTLAMDKAYVDELHEFLIMIKSTQIHLLWVVIILITNFEIDVTSNSSGRTTT